MMKNVVLYTKQYCPYCVHAKQLLSSKNVDFEEIRVDKHPEQRDIMIQKANGGWTVPQIFIGEEHVGGCNELFALDSQGKLDPLLSGE